MDTGAPVPPPMTTRAFSAGPTTAARAAGREARCRGVVGERGPPWAPDRLRIGRGAAEGRGQLLRGGLPSRARASPHCGSAARRPS